MGRWNEKEPWWRRDITPTDEELREGQIFWMKWIAPYFILWFAIFGDFTDTGKAIGLAAAFLLQVIATLLKKI